VECDFASEGPHTLVGFENHSGRTYLGAGVQPLGRVLAGWGNNGSDGAEGARYRNIYATYLHGPLLPKNPWLTDHLIRQGLAHRYGEAPTLITLPDEAEERAHQAALRLALRSRGAPAVPAVRWDETQPSPTVGGHRVVEV
jgi:CobQ-like glutamine amidotransferase family enzyme